METQINSNTQSEAGLHACNHTHGTVEDLLSLIPNPATITTTSTAGKALQELVEGGWLRRENPRNKGQFGGIDYYFTIPTAITHADKAKVKNGLKKRGVEFKSYEWRTATRVLDEQEIKRVQQDVMLEIATEKADLAGNEDEAIDLASRAVLRQQMAGEAEDRSHE